MRAMGLPTSLRPFTAATNGDEYKVYVRAVLLAHCVRTRALL